MYTVCPNAIIRQCISNATNNANSLICHKLINFRSAFSVVCVDIFYSDIMYCIKKSKANVLFD